KDREGNDFSSPSALRTFFQRLFAGEAVDVSRGRLGRGVPRMKGKQVSSLRQLHDERIIETVRAVVLGELRTQATRLHTNHGIELRIKIGGASEDFGGDLEFFNGSTRVIHGVLGQVTEQFAEGLRAMEGMAVGEPVDLLEHELSFAHCYLRIRRSNRSVTSRASLDKAKSYWK